MSNFFFKTGIHVNRRVHRFEWQYLSIHVSIYLSIHASIHVPISRCRHRSAQPHPQHVSSLAAPTNPTSSTRQPRHLYLEVGYGGCHARAGIHERKLVAAPATVAHQLVGADRCTVVCWRRPLQSNGCLRRCTCRQAQS